MLRQLDNRAGHYALLTLAWAALCLPNLGAASLWDVDEGNNASCAYEMWQSGDWVVPTCNYRLRVDKPALLYWMQSTAFTVLGPNEFSARLPSALAALAALLTVYELGRRTFGTQAGLLAGLLLGGSVGFCAAAHFANPDAVLAAASLFSLYFFWSDYRAGRRGWSAASAAAAGVAVLAKGPVGLLLPAAVGVVFLLCRRELHRLLSPRTLTGLLTFLLVAAPWYVWVAVATKGEWVAGFWGTHNQGRFLAAMEGHGGPFYYFALVVPLGCLPWSAFGLPALWSAVRALKKASAREKVSGTFSSDEKVPDTFFGDGPAALFLLVWLAVYIVFFSLSSTKLPNYVLPLYPAAALLTARLLDRWRRGVEAPPAWAVRGGLAAVALLGAGLMAGVFALGGPAVPWLHGRAFPGVEAFAWLGLLPLLGAAAAWGCVRAGRAGGAVAATAATAVLFTAAAAAFGPGAVEAWKAPRALAAALPPDQTESDVRVGTYGYFQPSLVFYCRREVSCLGSEVEAVVFLRQPLPAYLVVPAALWDGGLEDRVRGTRVLARRRDLYGRGEVVVVANRP
jgi:4-amino-4-deoxy-L-arabinose transferase-like glycosyltransferase